MKCIVALCITAGMIVYAIAIYLFRSKYEKNQIMEWAKKNEYEIISIKCPFLYNGAFAENMFSRSNSVFDISVKDNVGKVLHGRIRTSFTRPVAVEWKV
jgi:hypothetical protein